MHHEHKRSGRTKARLMKLAESRHVPATQEEADETLAAIDGLEDGDRAEVRAAFTRAAFDGPDTRPLSEYDRLGLAGALRRTGTSEAVRIADDLETRRGGNPTAVVLHIPGGGPLAIDLSQPGQVRARPLTGEGGGAFLPTPIEIIVPRRSS